MVGLRLILLLSVPLLLGWRPCVLSIAERAGLVRHDAERLADQLEWHSVDPDPTFLRMLASVAYVETRMRSGRVSPVGAVGILQVTQIAARHVHMHKLAMGEPKPVQSLTQLLSRLPQIGINVNTGSYYLKLALEEAGGNWILALAMYNGGYRALTAVKRNGRVPVETLHYVVQVMHIAHTCGRKE